MTKYIFVTGGVVSSLGKGIASASIGCILKSRGFRITLQKIDPYINVDPGTMSPFQHGEVYVTNDGAETDLDLGHYERFTQLNMTQDNNFTTGTVYNSVISKERKGEYLGGTVQVVPHITNEIKERIKKIGKNKDIVITEIGGVVGDIEGLPFLEAIRQMKLELGNENVINIHLTLVPFIETAGELKTKPTQHSVKELREIGIQPDVILCRTLKPLSEQIKQKIALFCNVTPETVIDAIDVKTIYEIPLMFKKSGLDEIIMRLLNLKSSRSNFSKWEKMVNTIKSPKYFTNIAVVGKYVKLQDAYKSIYEALIHGGIANKCEVNVKKIDAEELEKYSIEKYFEEIDGIIVPGGFDARGIEGKILAIKYARENNIPFLGLCLGMQLAVIEFARNMCNLSRANSTEFDKSTAYPVISLLQEQKKITNLGGTMRLGSYPCNLKENSLSHHAYKKLKIEERHRHRYEFNNEYRAILTKEGLVLSGIYEDANLVEIIELKNHKWFVATQFHPEYKSQPLCPHPLFRDFIKATL